MDNRQRSSDNLRALFSIFSGYEMAEPPLIKMAPKRKCKFNEDSTSLDLAKLPDSGMAQCNLCTDFSTSSGGRTDIRQHQESASNAKLAKSKGSTKEGKVQ